MAEAVLEKQRQKTPDVRPPDRGVVDGYVEHMTFRDDMLEACGIAAIIKGLMEDDRLNLTYSDFAIL